MKPRKETVIQGKTLSFWKAWPREGEGGLIVSALAKELEQVEFESENLAILHEDAEKKLQLAIKCLQNVVKHQEYVAGTSAAYSTVLSIIRPVLKQLTENTNGKPLDADVIRTPARAPDTEEEGKGAG